MRAAKRVGTIFEESTGCLAGFSLFHDPRPEETLVQTRMLDWASDKTFSEGPTSGRRRDSWWWVFLNCWAKKTKECLHCQDGRERVSCFAAITSGPRDHWESRASLTDLGYNCSVTVCDRQSRVSLITRDAVGHSVCVENTLVLRKTLVVGGLWEKQEVGA